MSKVSFPNQDMITIHKERYTENFLQVGKEEWMKAYANLKPGSFGLYLYLCGNMDGYRLALSSAAVQHALGYSDSTYRRAKRELKEKGYLVAAESSKHALHFFPTPPIMESSEMTAAAAPDTCAPAHETLSESTDEPDDSFLSYSYDSCYGWN